MPFNPSFSGGSLACDLCCLMSSQVCHSNSRMLRFYHQARARGSVYGNSIRTGIFGDILLKTEVQRSRFKPRKSSHVPDVSFQVSLSESPLPGWVFSPCLMESPRPEDTQTLSTPGWREHQKWWKVRVGKNRDETQREKPNSDDPKRDGQ